MLCSHIGILFHDSQAHYLIAIVDKLVKKPLESIFGILIIVAAAKEGPRSLGVLIVLVLGYQGERVLVDEVGGLVEGVERYAGLEYTVWALSACVQFIAG